MRTLLLRRGVPGRGDAPSRRLSGTASLPHSSEQQPTARATGRARWREDLARGGHDRCSGLSAHARSRGLALFPFYQAAGTYRWQEGDFTYDGKVDFDDILALFPNYGSNALFGGSGLGVGGGSGAGLGGGGGGSGDTAWLSGFGGSGTGETDAPATNRTTDPAANETAEMGPLPPPDMPGRPPITLVRNGNTTSPGDSIASSDASATSMAFAAIAAEQDEREKSDRKRDWLTVD